MTLFAEGRIIDLDSKVQDAAMEFIVIVIVIVTFDDDDDYDD